MRNLADVSNNKLHWVVDRWLKPRAVLLTDQIKASGGGGWPLGKRQVPLTPLVIESVDALTLQGDFMTRPALPARITVRDGTESVTEYALQSDYADSDRIVVEKINKSMQPGVEWKSVEHYDLAWFDALQKAEESYKKEGDGPAYLLDLVAACLTAVRKGWIKIEPEPVWLSDLSGICARIDGLDLEQVRSWFGDPKPGRTIAWETGYSRLRLGGESNERLELGSSRYLKSEIVVHASLRWVWEILGVIRSSPKTSCGREKLLAFLLGKLKEYGRTWKIEPEPVILQPWLRKIVRVLQLRYDLEQLDNVNLATIATQGLALVQGWNSRYLIMVAQGDKVTTAIMVELFQGGIERVSSLDVSKWTVIPGSGESRSEWLSEIQFELWDKSGWVNFIFMMDNEMLGHLVKVIRASLSPSCLGTLRSLWPLVQLYRHFLSGGVSAWPAEVFYDINKWRKREGTLSLFYRVSQVPFRRRTPRNRELLYVRETVVASIVVIIAVAIMIVIL